MASEPSAAQRKLFAKMHYAMPNGSFYIRPLPDGKDDLGNAIKAVGRGEQGGASGAAIRKHIMMRAAAIKLSSEIPDTWNPDGTLKEAAQSSMTLTDFFEHHGVKGMHWGVHKSSGESPTLDKAKTLAKTGAKKTIKFAKHHPRTTIAGIALANAAYVHRDEVKNTAYILGKIGAYTLKQATTKDSPVNQTLAIGRQVVQGYVVHGIDGVNALKPPPGNPPNEPSEISDHDQVVQAAEDHEAVAAEHLSQAKKTQAQDAELMKSGLDSPAAKNAYGANASKQGDGEFRAKNAMSKAQAIDKLHGKLQTSNAQHLRTAANHKVLAQKLRDKASKMSHDGLNFDPNFDVDVYLSHFGVKGMRWGVRNASSSDEERGQGKSERHNSRVAKTENQVNLRTTRINNIQSHIDDVNKNGINAELLAEKHGVAERMSPTLFKTLHGKTQEQAVEEHKKVLHDQLWKEQKALLAQSAKLAALHRGDKAKHSLTGSDDSLSHFGVKGMHWGVRKASGPASEDHAKATEIKGKIKENGGIHALSNDELKTLNERLNLETNYSRLNPEEVGAGQKAVGHLLGISGSVANQQANKYANKAASTAIDHLISEAGKAHASRKRNAPLRVVSIK